MTNTSPLLTQYFASFRQQLEEVFLAYADTPYGSDHPYHMTNSYGEFLQINPMDRSVIADSSDHIQIISGNELLFRTSGTTGQPTFVYIPATARTIPFNARIQNILGSVRPVFAHSRRAESEFFYWVHDTTHKDAFPQAVFAQYFDIPSVLNICRLSEVICIYEYPSALTRFLFFVKDALFHGLCTPQELEGKQLIVDLAGEPMDPGFLWHLSTEVSHLFTLKPIICLSYGTTEVGSIGAMDDWEPGQAISYQVGDSVFVEVVGQQSREPVIEEVGEIIVTPFRTKGTILLRYKTGDLGIMRFSHGKPYLTVLGKKRSEGAVYVAGSQFYLPDLKQALEKRFRLPVQIAAHRKIQPSGSEEVAIHIYIPPGSRVDEGELRGFLKAVIVQQAQLASELEHESVSVFVNVHAVPSQRVPVRKGWARVIVEGRLDRESRRVDCYH